MDNVCVFEKLHFHLQYTKSNQRKNAFLDNLKEEEQELYYEMNERLLL